MTENPINLQAQRKSRRQLFRRVRAYLNDNGLWIKIFDSAGKVVERGEGRDSTRTRNKP